MGSSDKCNKILNILLSIKIPKLARKWNKLQGIICLN